MMTWMDWMVQLEQRRMSLSRTGQERLEQLAYSKGKVAKQAKTAMVKPAARPTTAPVRCCPEAVT